VKKKAGVFGDTCDLEHLNHCIYNKWRVLLNFPQKCQRKTTHYTADEVKTLLMLSGEGNPDSAIATLLGRTECSIKNKRQALSCSSSDAAPRPWTREEEQLLLKMAAAGDSYKAVAENLGRTMSMVKWKLSSLRKLV
jgi:DNA-binding NarL/FixJ family response regulator